MHRVGKACRNLLIAGLVAGSGAAHAVPIVGIAVANTTATTEVVSDPDDTIDFYIPLRSGSSGTYGVDAGTSQDNCYYSWSNPPGTCAGGTLNMFLYFNGVTPGQNLLSLDFVDLDLDLEDDNGQPINDPLFFLEALYIFDAAQPGSPLASIDSLGADGAGLVITGDNDSQLIELPVLATNPFYIQLQFASGFAPGTPHGTYYNTEERLYPTIVGVVPAPGAIVLLGGSLLGLVLYRRRQRPLR